MNHLRNGRSLSWPFLHLDAANVQQQLHFEGSCTQPWSMYIWSMYTALKFISDLCIPHFNLPNSVFTGEVSHPHLVFHFDIAHIKLQRSFKIYASTWSWRASTNSTSPAEKQARLQHCIYLWVKNWNSKWFDPKTTLNYPHLFSAPSWMLLTMLDDAGMCCIHIAHGLLTYKQSILTYH